MSGQSQRPDVSNAGVQPGPHIIRSPTAPFASPSQRLLAEGRELSVHVDSLLPRERNNPC